jgi:hypothetical protein
MDFFLPPIESVAIHVEALRAYAWHGKGFVGEKNNRIYVTGRCWPSNEPVL